MREFYWLVIYVILLALVATMSPQLSKEKKACSVKEIIESNCEQ